MPSFCLLLNKYIPKNIPVEQKYFSVCPNKPKNILTYHIKLNNVANIAMYYLKAYIQLIYIYTGLLVTYARPLKADQ